MKYFLVVFLFFNVSLFTMELMKPITLPSTEVLTNKLDEEYYLLAHKLGGKTIYPAQVVMIINSFHNDEDNLAKKSKRFKTEVPGLIEKILSDYPDTVRCLKDNIFKI